MAANQRIEVTGEVFAADLKAKSFKLRLENDSFAEGSFSREQEALVVDALRDHQHKNIRVVGQAHFDATDPKCLRLVHIDEMVLSPVLEEEFIEDETPIWEDALEIGATIPDSVLERLPRDGAQNYRKYLYGTGNSV